MSGNTKKLLQLTLEETKVLAHLLAQWIRPGYTLLLFGNLGAGKSTFARYFINFLCPDVQNIPSPTFTLVETYETPKGLIWHCDLYRLKNCDEALELGLEEAFFETICLIEWPERLEGYFPEKRLEIHFQLHNDTTRSLTLKFYGFDDDERPQIP